MKEEKISWRRKMWWRQICDEEKVCVLNYLRKKFYDTKMLRWNTKQNKSKFIKNVLQNLWHKKIADAKKFVMKTQNSNSDKTQNVTKLQNSN